MHAAPNLKARRPNSIFSSLSLKQPSGKLSLSCATRSALPPMCSHHESIKKATKTNRLTERKPKKRREEIKKRGPFHVSRLVLHYFSVLLLGMAFLLVVMVESVYQSKQSLNETQRDANVALLLIDLWFVRGIKRGGWLH